jgi:uncharacterized membrane-anchored protein YitT (DUF2179 family)
MKKYLQNKIIVDIGFELLGNILIAAGTYNVAVASEFPLSGFNGIAMVFYRLFHFPIGMTVLVLNVIPALLCLKISKRLDIGRYPNLSHIQTFLGLYCKSTA